MSVQISRTAAPLPTETLEQILKELWVSTESPTGRLELFDTMSAVHPRLYDILVNVAVRYVIIDPAGRQSESEIELYKDVAARVAPDVDPRALFKSKYRWPTAFDLPAVEPAPPYSALFKRSHVRMDSFPLRDYNLDVRLRRFRLLLGDCTSFTLTTPPGESPLVHHAAIAMLICELLQHFPSLTHLHLDTYVVPAKRVEDCRFGAPPLAGVTFLRLTHYPQCECEREPTWPRLRADGHRERCPAACLLEAFPNLVELHLENPVFLKTLRPPRSLETLTIEAPPVVHIAGRAAYSTLIEYNVASAVRRGFMGSSNGRGGRKEEDSEQRRRRIVVLTGREDPYGWTAAVKACEEARVELVKVVEFPRPIERPELLLVCNGGYIKQ